jgi:hypothetical protein
MVKKSKPRESENMTAAESEALAPDGTSERALFRLMLSGLFARAMYILWVLTLRLMG